MDIGKAAIAAVLLESENPDGLIDHPNWYRRLFHALTDRGEIENNQLSVITFNYDRSFEYFFLTCLPGRYRKSPQERAASWVRNHVLHVYGDLGPLPEFAPTGQRYGDGKRDVEAIRAAMTDIHLVRAGESPRSFERARAILRDAERVVILGFGFDRSNSVRLGLHDLLGKGFPVHATLFELYPVDERNIIQEFTKRNGATISFNWFHGDAMAFMTEVGL